MSRKEISDKQVCEAVERYQAGIDATLRKIGFRTRKDAAPQGEPQDEPKFVDDILHEMTSQSRKVCMRAMERVLSRGLLNYGVSLRTAWLTMQGKQFLEKIEKQERQTS